MEGGARAVELLGMKLTERVLRVHQTTTLPTCNNRTLLEAHRDAVGDCAPGLPVRVAKSRRSVPESA